MERICRFYGGPSDGLGKRMIPSEEIICTDRRNRLIAVYHLSREVPCRYDHIITIQASSIKSKSIKP